MSIASKVLFVGLVSTVTLMVSEKSGEEFRADLLKKINDWKPKLAKFIKSVEEIWEASKEVDSNQMKINIDRKISQIRNEILNLNAEKSASIIGSVLKRVTSYLEKQAKSLSSNQSLQKAVKNFTKETMEFASATKSVINSLSNQKKTNIKKKSGVTSHKQKFKTSKI